MTDKDGDELALLDKVFLRFLSVESEEGLQGAVNKYLAPCLLKLGSEKEGVRKKVMELLVHVNKRVKSDPKISLPMESLIAQYRDSFTESGFVQNFTVIYLKMGFPRCGSEEKAVFLPEILRSLPSKPGSHQNSLLLMFVPTLPEITKDLNLEDNPETKSLLLDFIQDYLLLPYGSFPNGAGNNPPACMSMYSWRRVLGDPPYPSSETLESNKRGLCIFLGSDLVKPCDAILPIILALSDTRHSVVSKADDVMRKIKSSVDWSDSSLMSKINALFVGTEGMKRDKKAPPLPQDKIKSPANIRIRHKLLTFLLSSQEHAKHSIIYVPMIFDALFCSPSLTNTNLKEKTITLIQAIIDDCEERQLNEVGLILMGALFKHIGSIKKEEEASNPNMKAKSYLALGKLGAKYPFLVSDNLAIIEVFFQEMSREDKETQMIIKETLCLMSGSFKNMPPASMEFMDRVLAVHVEYEERQVRLLSVQYAGDIFEPSHLTTRYTLLLGAGDTDEEVSNSAKRYLYKVLNDKDLSKKKCFPDFEAMASLIFEKTDARLKAKKKFVHRGISLAYHPKVYGEILDYLRICLMNSALPDMIPKKDWLTQPSLHAPLISRYLLGLSKNKDSVTDKFLEFAEKLLEAEIGQQQIFCVLQLVGCTSAVTYVFFKQKIVWLKGLLGDTRFEVRESVAHLIGVVLSQFDKELFEKSISILEASFKERSAEYQHGIISALGFSFGNKILNMKLENEIVNAGEWEIYSSSFKTYILNNLNENQDSTDYTASQTLLLNGACSAIGEIGRCGPLPITSEEKLAVSKRLVDIVKKGKLPMRLRERAAIAAGLLCVGDMEFPHRQFIIDGLVNTAQNVEDVELHLSVGEALVYAALGPLSPIGRNLWVEKDYTPPTTDETHLEKLVDELINVHTKSSHPKTKQASCLWLLSLVKNSLEFRTVKERLLNIQSSFMGLLNESNELVQDAASKGLGIVYESCSEEEKSSMVNTLMGTLLDDRKVTVKQVTDDTKVFAEGELGKAPSGGNISTYKELCSLATDLNQPDLVYKFMHLANSNAAWESRKGAAFGFGSIAIRAGKQLEPLLPKIVPKLYRYQYDPTPRIQQSMRMIWNSLVSESNKTVDKYAKEILEEILPNLTSNQWRVRESCCGALQDLLKGRIFDNDALHLLAHLWNDLFRVMDDIKETVRTAASKAANALSNMCIKMTELGVKSGERTVEAILPVLLEKGLLSSVTEVKAVSLNTIMKITKNAGVALKPHLSILIPSLLEACSELEGKDVNYISTRLANDSSIQEKLDAARISVAKTSPMMECVNYVLQYVDKDSLPGLVPRLVELIKSSIGLNTKGVTAHFVVSLTHHCPLDMQPFTGKLLSAFVSGLSDRNRTVRKIYAGAIGNLMKTAKDSSVEKLIAKLKNWYVTDSSRLSVAYTFKAINQYNQDVVSAHAAQFMPLVFMAMHEMPSDEDGKEISQIWEEVWDDGTPGTESGIRLYLTEIIELLSSCMEAQQWNVRAQGARAMGTIATKLKSSLPKEEARKLSDLLVKGLTGRTWDGKESLLESLSSIYSNSSGVMDGKSNEDLKPVVDCLLRECKKAGNIPYRIAAISSTGKVFGAMQSDHFNELFEIVYPLIYIEKKSDDESKEEENSSKKRRIKYDDEIEEEREENKAKLDLQRSTFEALGRAWPKDSASTQKKYIMQFLNLVFDHVESTTIKNQTCLVKVTGEVVRKWMVEEFSDEEECKCILALIAQILSATLIVPKSLGLKVESLDTLSATINVIKASLKTLLPQFQEDISASLDDVVKDLGIDPSTKSKAREIKKSLSLL